MKKLFTILFILAKVVSTAQTSSGIAWDRYFITGSLSVGQGIKNAWANDALFLQVGKDTNNRGVKLSWVVDTALVVFPRPFGTEVGQLKDTSKYIWVGTYWKKIGVSRQTGIDSAAALGLITWSNVSGKPSTFTPSAHSHNIANITGLTDSLNTRAYSSSLIDSAEALRSAIALKQNNLGFTPYNSTNPAGYISSVPAQSFSSLTGKPTTLSGYGITDAYPLSGNPSGFLSSYTETDPTFNTKFAAKSTTDLAEGTNKYYTDAKVQAVIDADTGRGLSNLVTGGSLNKVKDSIAALISGGGVSVASVAEINTGTDNTKFLSPFAIQGSKYLDQTGTKIAGTTAGTSTAYTLNLSPAISAYTTNAIYNVTFHATNTGASTLAINGLAAKPLVKYLSTALVAGDLVINTPYQLQDLGTNLLVKDLGFAGVNTSASLFATINDETGGGGVLVGSASPTFTTSVVGGATFAAFNTTTTNLSLGGAATTYTEGAGTTTYTLGGTPTTALTANFFANATATGVTKTLNFGTGGASGSTTAINLGSATSGATNNIKVNITPASDATGDLWYRNASGFMTRLGIGSNGQVLTVATGLPSWAASGSGWAINGITASTGDWIGTINAQPWIGKVNSQRSMFIDAAGTYNAIYGYGAAPSLAGSYNVVIGGNACTGNTASTNSVFIGTSVASSQSGGDKNVCISGAGGGLPNTSGSNQVNIANLIWGTNANGTGTTPSGSVGIGTNAPASSRILDVVSTTQAVSFCRMTTTQRLAIVANDGDMVYDTTVGQYYYWKAGSSAWVGM